MHETDQDHASHVTAAPAEPAVAPDPLAHHFEGLTGSEFDADPAPEDTEPEPMSPGSRRRIVSAIVVLVALGLAAVLPPLINVNRYRRRIATSISVSLGRPVHLDSVTLTLLPTPGFVLTNFVVDEDPAFGSEPVIRANTVRARLRLRSLWQRKVEFSRITLAEPSLNLVHAPGGKWNIESILVQASRMPVIPTEATHDNRVQRFPYIEATGARVNLKEGLEKKPISLTDAEFALWLPEPGRWHLRLEAHPARTDTAATDTGVFRLEGTLGKAATLGEVPVDLTATWQNAPLGAASWVIAGRDLGLRGEMTLHARAQGTLGGAAFSSRLELRRLRRADFVPAHTLDVDATCKATAYDALHRFEDIACGWPNADGNGGITVKGRLADIRNPVGSAEVDAHWKNVAAAALLDLSREASEHIAPDLTASGRLAGTLTCCRGGLNNVSGALTGENLRLAQGTAKPWLDRSPLDGTLAAQTLTLAPLTLDLGGAASQPATLTLQIDRAAMHLHLTGPVLRSRLLALAQAVPPLGDGLQAALPPASAGPESPLRVDLTGSRPWTGLPVWTAAPAKAPPAHGRRRR